MPDTALVLDAGDRFRLTKSGRRNIFEFGLGSQRHGTLRLFSSGDLALTLDGREYAIRPAGNGWDLLLLDGDDNERGRYTAGKRGAGTITTSTTKLELTPPRRRRKTGELADATDGTPIAELRIQGGVVLFELVRSTDPLAAALAASVVVLRSTYKPPTQEIRPVWEPSRAAWWGAALATGWGMSEAADLQWSDPGFADGPTGGGGDSGGF